MRGMSAAAMRRVSTGAPKSLSMTISGSILPAILASGAYHSVILHGPDTRATFVPDTGHRSPESRLSWGCGSIQDRCPAWNRFRVPYIDRPKSTRETAMTSHTLHSKANVISGVIAALIVG